jgi:hypothetical protein
MVLWLRAAAVTGARLPRKKDPPTKPTAPPAVPRFGATRGWLVQSLTVVLLAGALLAGLVLLGRWCLEQIRGQDRYAALFADIECTAPPGMEKGAFLDEVQYLSRVPDRLGLLDEDLRERLAAAFAKHPWVEKVDAVILEPPRRVQVRLVMRRPVLAVPTKEGLVAVDGRGVRLPRNATTKGLPEFQGEASPPRGPAGSLWGDAKVEARARQENGR